ncbi:XRE family transcriptional regulator [Latilactobacillus curvatus]|uniref:XRE family transcriptional regulator n=1 Tax=Latilactobacillus curvatus TaxID=28038 RepID=A0AAC9Y0D6_LATCU|nr:helix-turn-helix transcriptional regulator [Latilactobacillus curvatus]ASN59790.1 XRE family transcriptional regulator [Latilactobacillus curvatus]
MTKGQRIAELRKQKRISQSELSKAIHVSPSTIGMWETDQRAIKDNDLVALAKYFNVTTDYLLGKSETKSVEPNDNAMLIAAHIEDDATEEDMAKILDYIEMVKKSKNK